MLQRTSARGRLNIFSEKQQLFTTLVSHHPAKCQGGLGDIMLLMAPGKGWEWGSSGFGSSKWMGAVRQSPGVGPLRRSALGYGFGGFPFYWNPFTLPWCLFACFYIPCRQAL